MQVKGALIQEGLRPLYVELPYWRKREFSLCLLREVCSRRKLRVRIDIVTIV